MMAVQWSVFRLDFAPDTKLQPMAPETCSTLASGQPEIGRGAVKTGDGNTHRLLRLLELTLAPELDAESASEIELEYELETAGAGAGFGGGVLVVACAGTAQRIKAAMAADITNVFIFLQVEVVELLVENRGIEPLTPSLQS